VKERPAWEKRNHWWQGGEKKSKESDVPREAIAGNELLMRQSPHRRFHEEHEGSSQGMTRATKKAWRERVRELLMEQAR